MLCATVFVVGTDALHASSPVANVRFVHDYINRVHNINVPINASANQNAIANRRYLLCTIDRANQIRGGQTTNFCAHALAANTAGAGMVAMNTIDVRNAISSLIQSINQLFVVPGTTTPVPPMTIHEVWNHSFNGTTVAGAGTGINGNVQTRTLQPGTYLLEVWGADGGGRINNPTQFPAGGTMFRGGNGGFSRGILTITSPQTIHIYVGGAGGLYGAEPSGTNHPGGWNGGGGFRQGSSAGGARMGTGGGASDIRTTGGAWNLAASRNSRFIVAGGGGGEAGWTGAHEWTGGWGGNGGGAVAQIGHHQPVAFSTANGGQPGTQTGSPTSFAGTNAPAANQLLAGNIPGFGQGGNNGAVGAEPVSNNIRSGGGGGWFGGMSGAQRSAGGGSGFVFGLNQGGEHLTTAPAWARLTHGANAHFNWQHAATKPAGAGRHGHVRISRITLN